MVTGRTVLLADDSPTVQKVVSLTFADEGITVVTAAGGAEALEKLRATAPDVVLADVHMPRPNGYQICEYIKCDERLRHVPVVLLVGTFEPFNEAEARRVGADDVLTKPFQSIRDLFGKVAHLFGPGGAEKSEGSEYSLPPRTDDAETAGASAALPTAALPAAPPVKWEQPVTESWQRPQTSTSSAQPFADPGMDDLSIKSHPAESQTPPAQNGQQAKHRKDPAGPKPTSTKPATAKASAAQASAAAGVQMRAALTSFDTRAANANAADDALLDLGDDADTVPFAPSDATADDDFFLDIGDEPPPLRPMPELVKAYERKLSSPAAASAAALKQSVAPSTVTKEAANSSSAAAARTSVPSSLEGAIRATAHSMNIEQLPPEMIDVIAHRVVEQMSDKVVREIAWEVVPELADRLIKQRLDEQKLKA